MVSAHLYRGYPVVVEVPADAQGFLSILERVRLRDLWPLRTFVSMSSSDWTLGMSTSELYPESREVGAVAREVVRLARMVGRHASAPHLPTLRLDPIYESDR